MEEDIEYLNILDLFLRIVQSNVGVKLTDLRLAEAESLARKFFMHCASVFYLGRCTTIKDFPSTLVDFLDAPSINVIARAIVETYLTFHYVFGSNVSEHEREFRFYSWQLGGYKDRQKYLSMVSILKKEADKIKASDQECIQHCEDIIKSNAIFLSLKPKQQSRILDGNWKIQSWREIALDARLSELHANVFYSYLCGWAHSSSLSTLQLSEANIIEKQRELIGGSIGVIKIAMSNFTLEYSELFPMSKLELDRNKETRRLAEDWVLVGRKV